MGIKIIDGDVDLGAGGVSRFNSETGKEEIIRQPENPDQPFTISDYNKALEGAQQPSEKNIMSDDVKQQQVKRADMINAQNEVSEKQQVDTGEKVPENKKSVALNVTIQAPDRTLKDSDLENLSQKIISAIKETFGAELRS